MSGHTLFLTYLYIYILGELYQECFVTSVVCRLANLLLFQKVLNITFPNV